MTAYCMEHWFLAFLLALLAIEWSGRLAGRFLRTFLICVRGWPPDHIDADGDWRPGEDEP